MPEITRPGSRLDPTVAWTYVTDAPLGGLSMAREAGELIAWDDANHVVKIDARGERIAENRAPGSILGLAISDTGNLVALLVEGPRLILLDGDFQPIADRPAAGDARTVAVDPHGRYVAVASASGRTQLFTAHGKSAGGFETLQPLSCLRFVAVRPLLLGASPHGSLFGLELSPRGKSGSLAAEELWRGQVMSKIGRVEATGDGGMILASCYTHGIQRFDSRGRNEGAYHLGGTVGHAVPDFPGRTIAVATTEGELSILNGTGNVRWKTGLARGPVALEMDALGRHVVYGLPTGEIVRLDLETSGTKRARGSSGDENIRAVSGSIRAPLWTIPVASTDEQAETAVPAVLDDPRRVAVITNRNTVQVFTQSGGSVGEAPTIIGVGRILRTAPGWIVAATDRHLVLYDARRNVSERLDPTFVEITHLQVQPDTFGLAIVQERDRIGRMTAAGRWVWKRELKSAVEELAIGPDSHMAVSTDDGQLLVFDAAGECVGRFTAEPPEPLALVAAPSGAPADLAWITLARYQQVLAGHRRDGQVIWRTPVPWEGWQLHLVDAYLVVEGLDGRAMAFDATGHPLTQGRAESSTSLFACGPANDVLRVYKSGEHLLCTDLSGRVQWRTIATEPIGPLAVGRSGVSALLGRSLAWFPFDLGSEELGKP